MPSFERGRFREREKATFQGYVALLESGDSDPQTPWSPGTFFWDTPRGERRRALAAALPRASSEHSPSGQGDPYKGMDNCPIPQIEAPGETCLAPGNGLEADTPTRTQARLCHPPHCREHQCVWGCMWRRRLGGLYPRCFLLGHY